MPVRTCRPSLYWARRMSWVPSEKMMFTEIRVRGSGPCLLPVLGASTHVHAAQGCPALHTRLRQSRLCRVHRNVPLQQLRIPRLCLEDARLHLIMPLPSLTLMFPSANSWEFKCPRRRADHTLTLLPSLTPLHPETLGLILTLYTSVSFALTLSLETIKKPRNLPEA